MATKRKPQAIGEDAPEETPAPPPSLDSLLGQGTAPESAEPKRKRGRPPGSKNKAKGPGEPMSADEAKALGSACGQLWSITFAIVAVRLGDKWKLTAQETSALGDASIPVVRQYLPAFSGHYPAIMLGLLVSGIVGSRVMMPEESPPGPKPVD